MSSLRELEDAIYRLNTRVAIMQKTLDVYQRMNQSYQENLWTNNKQCLELEAKVIELTIGVEKIQKGYDENIKETA
jgi:hypothetical protein